jgi:hypothetical protein
MYCGLYYKRNANVKRMFVHLKRDAESLPKVTDINYMASLNLYQFCFYCLLNIGNCVMP